MALGSSNNTQDFDLFFLKVAGQKKGESAHFTVLKPKGARKEGQKMEYETLPSVKDVSGNIVGAKIKKREFEGEEKFEITVILKDEEAKQLYYVSCNMNMTGRSIINSLLALDGPKGGKLSISVYNNKKKEGRQSVALTYDGHKTNWRFDLAEQDKHIVENKITRKGVQVIEKDYFKLDQFLLKHFAEDFIPQYGAPKEHAQQDAKPKGEPVVVDDTSDLPF